jgi:branched-chain amino acid transport system substrate-binding protein
MGDDAIGLISANYYSAQLDYPENKRFVAEMLKEYKAEPGYYAAGCHIAGRVLEAALQKVDGKIEDKQAFMQALRALKVEDTVRGPLSFDQYGNAVGNIYIRKVEKKGGRLVNTVIKTYPDVSQFWTYDPAAFMQNPVYSRDWPPAKNLL